MSRSVPANQRSPFPRRRAAQVATGVAMLLVMIFVLALMGRHPVCECGRVTVIQMGSDPAENSQQFADWYSLLHVAFGMGLYAVVHYLRPRWRLAPILLAVVFGHSIWEIAENTPWIIGVFSGGANAPQYSGDSILNSVGDSVFALVGATLMPRLSLPAIIAILAAIEGAVTWGVGDGLIVGTLRLLGVDI